MASVSPGDRVLVIAWPYGGRTATVLRPARLLWKRAWLVEFDERPPGGLLKERVVEHGLIRLPLEE